MPKENIVISQEGYQPTLKPASKPVGHLENGYQPTKGSAINTSTATPPPKKR